MARKLLDRLLGFLDDAPQREAQQQQREALLDLLILAMFADRHIAAPEQAAVRERAAALPWDSPRPLDVFVDSSVRRARRVLGDVEAEREYLADIGQRLGDAEARRAALVACEELAHVDGDLSAAEEELLARARTSFASGPDNE